MGSMAGGSQVGCMGSMAYGNRVGYMGSMTCGSRIGYTVLAQAQQSSCPGDLSWWQSTAHEASPCPYLRMGGGGSSSTSMTVLLT
jgi:hypothetical protein